MKIILVDAVHTFIDTEGEIFQEMHVMLERLPKDKVILTNADYKDNNKYNLQNAPYKVFTCEHNPEKTDPEYYRIMLKELNLSVEDVVYFEHSIGAVESARSI